MISNRSTILGLCILLVVTGTVFADDQVMFNYQGRVRVQGTAFNGTGYFKFAIVNNPGTITLWSNDGTSVGGSEPSASVSVTVTDGIFNVMVGDPDLGMQPINRSIFNHPSKIKLRIWFSDGTHGFQQLLPDRRLINPQLIGIVSGTEDFTIYVNGKTGNDDDNGLTTDTAKRTIQAAVDVLPERLRCSVTIDIADGVYLEQVDVFGITVKAGKYLIFLGDESWTPAFPGDPAVRITGTDDDTTQGIVRSVAFLARKCYGVKVKGFLFDYASTGGVLIDVRGEVQNCKVAHNWRGISIQANSEVYFTDCLAEQNDTDGFYICTFSWGTLTNCISKFNGRMGVDVNSLCRADFGTSGDFSNNGENGVHLTNKALGIFLDGYSGEIRNNGGYGLGVIIDSVSWYHIKNTFSGNALGDVLTGTGGHAY